MSVSWCSGGGGVVGAVVAVRRVMKNGRRLRADAAACFRRPDQVDYYYLTVPVRFRSIAGVLLSGQAGVDIHDGGLVEGHELGLVFGEAVEDAGAG